ncbi:MAG: ABC transporter permease [Dehalococcoidia bacterium]
MSTESRALAVTAPGETSYRTHQGRLAYVLLKFARRQPVGTLCFFVVLFTALVAVAAPLIVSDPYAIDPDARLQAPSRAHPFGTDELGRDLLARVVYGARTSMYVGLGAVLLGIVAGAVLGITSGYVGGLYDLSLQRLIDAAMALPTLLLALVLVATIGNNSVLVVVAIGLAFAPTIARVVRSSAISVRASPMIEAAQAVGSSDLRIMIRYVGANTVPVLIVLASAFFSRAIIVEASLSFLGLGIPPPEPSWGRMLSGAARQHLEQAPWIAIFPGAALTTLALSLNFLGDAVRDTIDPRLRSAGD